MNVRQTKGDARRLPDRDIDVSMRRFILPAIVLISIACGDCRQAIAGDDGVDIGLAVITPDEIRADMGFLADDLLEGRGAANRGYRIAARDVAARFEAIGLRGAGDAKTFYQRVPIRSSLVDKSKSSAELRIAGHAVLLSPLFDYVLTADPGRAESNIEAPVVFVGYGVTAPTQDYDDYRGIDVKGKIVAVVDDAPNSFPSEIRAHYSASWLKRANAVSHGAVGYILLYDQTLQSLYPFTERLKAADLPSMKWIDPEGRLNDYFPALKVVATLSMAGANRLFMYGKNRPDSGRCGRRSGTAQNRSSSGDSAFPHRYQNA